MSSHQPVPAPAPPEHPDPIQNLFDHLVACLTVRDPQERNAQASETLNTEINGLVANSEMTELIGLACEVAQSLTDDQRRAEVAAQLLTPAARAVLAGSDDGGSLVWALTLAHSFLTEEARTEVVGGLLTTQTACERIADMALGFASRMRPGPGRQGVESVFVAPHLSRHRKIQQLRGDRKCRLRRRLLARLRGEIVGTGCIGHGGRLQVWTSIRQSIVLGSAVFRCGPSGE